MLITEILYKIQYYYKALLIPPSIILLFFLRVVEVLKPISAVTSQEAGYALLNGVKSTSFSALKISKILNLNLI